MSNALAIAGVTAVLQYYLNNLYSQANVASNFPSSVTVSCLAPDQVQNQIESGTPDTENQVNLFLHQVTHNAAWRNVDFASISADGTQRTGNPPLALDLHYLLTVYGSEYWQAEALLGYALMMLHEAPVLTRTDIANAIQQITGSPPPFPENPPPPPYPANPLTGFLNTAGLADQIEMIKITPESMSREELAWLWTALKADYRPTFPFQVSVVLLQPDLTSSFALPVLQTVFAPTVDPKGQAAVPMQTPQILSIQVPSGQIGAEPGQTVTVTGVFLSGASQVSLTNARYGLQLTPLVTQSQAESLNFVLPPDVGGEYPAGVYDLAVQFMDPTNTFVQTSTNTLQIAIAPGLPAQSATTSSPGGTATLVTINSFSPVVWEGQDVVLALSTLSAPLTSVSAQAQAFVGPPNSPAVSSLSFLFDDTLPTGVGLLGRLQVDGVTSAVTVDTSVFPPFLGPLVTL
jgi:hypothetical protein